MSNPITTMEQLLQQAFNPDYLHIEDVGHLHKGHAGAKEGGHFILTIQSTALSKVSLLESHRMIYEALGDLKTLGVHALTIKRQQH